MSVVNIPAWPARILLDEPFATALPKELDSKGAKRVFIITTGSLARREELVEQFKAALGGRFVGLYSNIPAHTSQVAAVEAIVQARAANTDTIVSIGGGSVSDTAKVVLAGLSAGVTDVKGLQAWRAARHPAPDTLMPHITLPTTLSLAEMTWFAGSKNPDTHLKEAFAEPWLMPASIMYDAELTLLTPDRLWLSTGLRAVDHAVETLLSLRSNGFADALCLSGLERLLPALATTAKDRADLAARGLAQLGGVLCSAGLISGVPMGASHSIGHVLGSLFDVPHGITSCVMLPSVMRFNGEYVPQRLNQLKRVLGDDPAEGLRKQIAALGLPTTLSEIGITAKDHARILSGLGHEAWMKANPRPISMPKDVETILAMAA